ncbi:hypothetical protein Tco_0167806 [Tanacetum coccineum]
MMTYLKNMGGYKHSQLKGKTYEEIQGLYEREQKFIHDFVPMDSGKEETKSIEPESKGKKSKILKRTAGSYETQKSPKKPKVMKSVKNVTEEEAAEYEKRFPIVNWEYKLLGNVDAKDMLVQERFQDHLLEGHDLLLWGDLRMLFDPDEKDELWMNQLDWKLPKWKLYESCGVHTLFMNGTPMEINMLVEKKYPLIKELLEKMLNLQLEAEEESTVAFKLIKFIKSMLEEQDTDALQGSVRTLVRGMKTHKTEIITAHNGVDRIRKRMDAFDVDIAFLEQATARVEDDVLALQARAETIEARQTIDREEIQRLRARLDATESDIIRRGAVEAHLSESINVLAVYGDARPSGSAIEQLIADRMIEAVVAALTQHEANRANNARGAGGNARGDGGNVGGARGNVRGAGGNAGGNARGNIAPDVRDWLSRWFEKLESVFQISKCVDEDRGKYAVCTLPGRTLT